MVGSALEVGRQPFNLSLAEECFMIATLAMIAVSGLMADGVSTKVVPGGVTAKLGGYSPIRAEMDAKLDSVKKAPEGLTAPKYGSLKLDQKSWSLILDEPEGKPARLYVDTNGDGDLTNDPETTWTAKTTGGLTMHDGQAKVELGPNVLGTVRMYRFDPTDAKRPQLKNTLLYYPDFGTEVTIDLDGKQYTSLVAGKPQATSSFWIDRDGNRKRSYKLETAQVNKPFNFTGTTYVLRLKAGELGLEKAAVSLPLAPLPPDLTVGKPALTFEAVTTDGAKIDFPKTYAGKLVMLDFWATWCGPCIAELPNVKKAYADWHDKGFEILSISFDQEGMAEKLKKFTTENDMPWPQIYEGKYWNTTIGEQHDVSGIPFVLLIDGDTSEIIATERELRGPGLSKYIGDQLAKKKGEAK
jgi:thiol-disulfide isomerase/thioredoxin